MDQGQLRGQLGNQAQRGRQEARSIHSSGKAVPATGQPQLLALLVAAAVAVMAVGSSSALAQTAAVQETRQPFEIPAQALLASLKAFGRQAQVQVLFDDVLIEGRQGAAVNGSYTPREALQRLLAGTGLMAVSTQSGTFTIRAEPGAASATALPEVTVTADLGADGTTEGTGSYTQTGSSRTATGLSLSLRETPQSVSVMTRQRMDDFNLDTMVDAVEQVPGVNVAHQASANTFQIRGSNAILSTDGNRMGTVGNAAFYNSSTLNTLDDMADIDRIEVLKGSAGLTQGDGIGSSYGGVINLVRKKPTREFQASATAGAGSWNVYRVTGDVSGPLNQDATVRGRVVAAAGDAKSFRDYEKSSNKLLYATVDWDITPDTLLNVGASYKHREIWGTGSTSSIQYWPALGILPRSFNPGAPWAGYKQNTVSAFASLEQRLANDWTAKLQVSHEKIKSPWMEFGYLWTSFADRFAYRNNYNENQSASIDIRGPFELLGRRHEFLLNAGVSSQEQNNQESNYDLGQIQLADYGIPYASGGAAIPQVENYIFDDAAAVPSRAHRRYVSATGRFSIVDPLKLIAGVRLSDYRFNSNNNAISETSVLTPYVGMVYELTPTISWYGSYASIFNPQTARDINRKTLDPETGVTYETGLKGEFFDKRLNASLSYFWMRTDNTAESTDTKIPGTNETAYRAVSGVIRTGYELELSGELAPGWQAQGSVVQNSSNLGTSVQYPKHQFKLGSSYRFHQEALQGLSVGAATRWQSKVSGNIAAANLIEQKPYWVVDLMARYSIDRQWSVGANVKNLFDKHYFAGVGYNQYTWGAPRSFNVNMRYDF